MSLRPGTHLGPYAVGNPRHHGPQVLSSSHELMSAALPGGDPALAAAPRALFQARVPATGNQYRTNYAVTADGQRFIVNTRLENVAPTPLTVVLNWPAGLRSEGHQPLLFEGNRRP